MGEEKLRCSTCRHWRAPASDFEVLGDCTYIGAGKSEVAAAAESVTSEFSFFTAAGFGCVLHVPLEVKS